MAYRKPSLLHYRIAQVASWFVATFIFRRKIVRNEIKGKKGPFVVIANHEAMLDFVNLIGMRARPMSFVISQSFFNAIPLKGFMTKMGVIPKQQFQTTPRDMKQIKAVIDQGESVVIYPSGLMCEDGLNTPIPAATYKFLKWLNVDVYAAKVSGTYFAMPKWAKGMRPGKTYIDIYKLFSKEELENADIEQVRQKANEVLVFDAYRDQEELRVKYKNGDNLEGLQHVLYMCPHCGVEFSMEVRDGNVIYCRECGYAETSDVFAFLHRCGEVGEEIRYVSDWSRQIYQALKDKMAKGLERELFAETAFHMIDKGRNKFIEVGTGSVHLTRDGFAVRGTLHGEVIDITVPIGQIPTLPFSPGKHFEIQHGKEIYRCVLRDGRLVMKFINMVKIFYDLRTAEMARV